MLENENPPELSILRGHANAISDFISHTNYGAGIDVQGFTISDSQFVLKEILKSAFPTWERNDSLVAASSADEFNETIRRCLKFDFYYYGEVSESSLHEVDNLNQQIILGFLDAVKVYINYEQSEIYLCKDSVGVIWSFTFVIYDDSAGRCLVIDGAADD